MRRGDVFTEDCQLGFFGFVIFLFKSSSCKLVRSVSVND